LSEKYINILNSVFNMNYAFVQKQDYRIGYIQENIEMVFYCLVCFFVPFLLGHPQFLVGIVVNACLILASLNLRGYKLLPVIIFPSLGVLSRGMIFGPFTIFLIYMIPFIWIGNALMVYAFKSFSVHKKINKWVSLVGSVVIKAVFLFGAAFALVNLGVLPKLFLTAMGVFQFYTAILGGVVALSVQGIKKKLA